MENNQFSTQQQFVNQSQPINNPQVVNNPNYVQQSVQQSIQQPSKAALVKQDTTRRGFILAVFALINALIPAPGMFILTIDSLWQTLLNPYHTIFANMLGVFYLISDYVSLVLAIVFGLRSLRLNIRNKNKLGFVLSISALGILFIYGLLVIAIMITK